MKSKFKILSVVLFFLLTFGFMLNSCAINIIKEYKGKEIAKLTYVTKTYYSGFTETSILDFIENEFHFEEYDPYAEAEGEHGEIYDSNFSDEEEAAFLNACYTYGLFDIDPIYVLEADDGFGWVLEIEYKDGTKKRSEGRNSAPYKVFNNCATVFFDLCGHEVLGTLPMLPPRDLIQP